VFVGRHARRRIAGRVPLTLKGFGTDNPPHPPLALRARPSRSPHRGFGTDSPPRHPRASRARRGSRPRKPRHAGRYRYRSRARRPTPPRRLWEPSRLAKKRDVSSTEPGKKGFWILVRAFFLLPIRLCGLCGQIRGSRFTDGVFPWPLVARPYRCLGFVPNLFSNTGTEPPANSKQGDPKCFPSRQTSRP
jgi:hypothetical protein